MARKKLTPCYATMGDWINVNGEAIYATRAIEPYKTDNICLTQKKDTKEVYAIYLDETFSEHLTESEKLTGGLPASFTVKGIFAANNATLSMLGAKGNLKWENTAEGVKFTFLKKYGKICPVIWRGQ
jgi:alpha-L-fucosidase